MTDAPLIVWFRRDLRLGDHMMLAQAVATGRPLIPVFILDPETAAMGAAPLWRLGLGVAAFDAALQVLGSRLILRRGPALAVLLGLVAETGAAGVMWQRLYDPAAVALGKLGINCWGGDFYAVRPLTAMGVDLDKGVLRMSLVHYTSAADVTRLIGALDRVL